MRIQIIAKPAAQVRVDLKVIPVVEKAELEGAVKELPNELRTALAARAKRSSFRGKPGASLTLQGDGSDLVLIGLGEKPTGESWRRAAGKARAIAGSLRARDVAICVGTAAESRERVAPSVEGFVLAGYAFDKYRSEERDEYRGPRRLVLAGSRLRDDAGARRLLRATESACEAVTLTRDLVNETSGVKTPSYLAATARRIARRSGLRCQVWQGARLRRERMNGILAVSAGSRQPGALIKLVYRPAGRPKKRVVLVGKGITFDSGGLSLKPAQSMMTMKMDMSGAAAVLAVMQALAVAKPPIEVTGYIASAENMPSGTAQRPGDVITFRNGKTAEVLNTDAEGRLVLADALCLAAESKPDVLIDLATLTGACIAALGTDVAGILGNDQDLVDRLIECGRDSGEQLWQLPLVEDYMEDIRSSVADIKNIGSAYAGTITAALFLRCFVGDCRWAHLDIAGTAFREKPAAYSPKGGSGFAVRTLLRYLTTLE